MAPKMSARSVQGSVVDFLKLGSGPLAHYRYALVSALDSVLVVAETSTAARLRERDPSIELLGRDLLMTTDSLRDALRREDLLTGFDEVWFFGQRPTVPRPAPVTIIPPLDPDQEPLRSAIEAWMTEAGCDVGVADGLGLTMVTFSDDMIDGLAQVGPPSDRDPP